MHKRVLLCCCEEGEWQSWVIFKELYKYLALFHDQQLSYSQATNFQQLLIQQ